MVVVLESPLSVPVSAKRNMILNLNNYRFIGNARGGYHTLNNAKVKYKELMTDQLNDKLTSGLQFIAIQYKVYKGDKRRFDIGNICSIHQKFFEDALVESGKISDDRHENIPLTFYTFGGIDKDNPRVDVIIYNLLEEEDRSKLQKDIEELID